MKEGLRPASSAQPCVSCREGLVALLAGRVQQARMGVSLLLPVLVWRLFMSDAVSSLGKCEGQLSLCQGSSTNQRSSLCCRPSNVLCSVPKPGVSQLTLTAQNS